MKNSPHSINIPNIITILFSILSVIIQARFHITSIELCQSQSISACYIFRPTQEQLACANKRITNDSNKMLKISIIGSRSYDGALHTENNSTVVPIFQISMEYENILIYCGKILPMFTLTCQDD